MACEFVSEENKFWNIDIFNGRPRGWWRELALNLWSGPGGLQKDFISLLVVRNCASSSVFWSMRRLFLLLFDNNFGKHHGKGRHIWLTMGASSFRPKCRIHEQEFDNKFRVLNRNPPVHKYVHIGRLRGWSFAVNLQNNYDFNRWYTIFECRTWKKLFESKEWVRKSIYCLILFLLIKSNIKLYLMIHNSNGWRRRTRRWTKRNVWLRNDILRCLISLTHPPRLFRIFLEGSGLLLNQIALWYLANANAHIYLTNEL